MTIKNLIDKNVNGFEMKVKVIIDFVQERFYESIVEIMEDVDIHEMEVGCFKIDVVDGKLTMEIIAEYLMNLFEN